MITKVHDILTKIRVCDMKPGDVGFVNSESRLVTCFNVGDNNYILTFPDTFATRQDPGQTLEVTLLPIGTEVTLQLGD